MSALEGKVQFREADLAVIHGVLDKGTADGILVKRRHKDKTIAPQVNSHSLPVIRSVADLSYCADRPPPG
jgi:hypothetical protein